MKIQIRFVILVAGLLASVGLFNESRLHALRGERDRLRAEVPKKRPVPATALVTPIRKSSGQRTALLGDLLNHLATLHDPKQVEEVRREAFEAFARGVDPGSTDSDIEWISGGTALEKALFAEGLTYSSTGEASGRWLEWMALNLNPAQLGQPVADLMEEWTEADYQAAGKWLATTAESPAKQVAVQAYVEVIANYEPQVAIQWAMTLPEGAKRDASLSAIHGNWPLDDPEGKTAFQRAHNME